MSKILVTGGTGYIGSHTIVDLLTSGYDVVSVDNYSNSDTSALKGIEKITGKTVYNYPIDLVNRDDASQIFVDHPDISAIIHFAALKAVGESVNKPGLYFRNNLNSLLTVLELSREHDVKHFIFSSSCTVYGNAKKLPVTEQTPESEAESPYGRTKQIGEKMVKDMLYNTGVKSICLRYFNPAGAHPSGQLGESPINLAQNLVPVITETAIGKRKTMTVFGDDYDTRDGSCVRDYIHVSDLANAHTRAVSYLEKNNDAKEFDVMNLGIGKGVTVLEAVKAFEAVAQRPLNYSIGPRREGDVIAIYADDSYARSLLGWQPKYSIEDIMKTAWEWEKKRSS